MNDPLDKAMAETIEGAQRVQAYAETLWRLIGEFHYKNGQRTSLRLPNAKASDFRVSPGIIKLLTASCEVVVEMDWEQMDILAREMFAQSAKMRAIKNAEHTKLLVSNP